MLTPNAQPVPPMSGFSLVEIMIAMTIGMSVLSGLTSYTANVIGFNAESMAQMRLKEELQTIGVFLSREIKRAGTKAKVEHDAISGDSNNLAKESTYALSHYPSETKNSCLLFYYDRDLDGHINSQANSEFYGFRLKDRAIEYRIGGAKCDQNGWQDLSDPNIIKITKLQFTPLSRSGALIQIDLAGQLKQRHGKPFELRLLVRVMNHD